MLWWVLVLVVATVEKLLDKIVDLLVICPLQVSGRVSVLFGVFVCVLVGFVLCSVPFCFGFE